MKMKFSIYWLLLVAVIETIYCSINVTRGNRDNIYDKTVGGNCYSKYNAWYNDSVPFCTCQQQNEYKLFSIAGEEAKCNDLNNLGCDVGTIFNFVVTFDRNLPNKLVNSSFIWNLKQIGNNNGTWLKLPDRTNSLWDMQSKAISIANFGSNDKFKGQLVKLNLSNRKCLVFAFDGNITYPFNIKSMFPEFYSTTAPSTTKPEDTTTASVNTTAATPLITIPTTTTALPTMSTAASSTAISIMTTISAANTTAATSQTTIPTTTTGGKGNRDNNRGKDEGVSKSMIIALAVVSSVVVLLVIIIVILCRKRRIFKVGRGNKETGKNGHVKDEGLYLNPVDVLPPVYQDANSLATSSGVRPEIGNPAYTQKQPGKTDNNDNGNLYSCIGQDQDEYSTLDHNNRRSRQESLLSSKSSTELIGIDEQNQRTYSMIMPSPQDGTYAGLNPITENYETIPNATYQDAYENLPDNTTNTNSQLETAEPLYFETSAEEDYAIVNPKSDYSALIQSHENYETLDDRTRTSSKGDKLPSTNNDISSDIYTPVDQNGVIEQQQENYEELNNSTRLSALSGEDGIRNPVYDADINENYYHTLEMAGPKS